MFLAIHGVGIVMHRQIIRWNIFQSGMKRRDIGRHNEAVVGQGRVTSVNSMAKVKPLGCCYRRHNWLPIQLTRHRQMAYL